MNITKLYLKFLKKISPILYARKIGVQIGENCRLIHCSFSTEPYLVNIGNHVSATAVRFETHDGGVWCFREMEPDIDLVKTINIGNNVYLGFEAVVLPGVSIGDNVIVGARALVTRDIPSNSVAVGIPARVIKSLEDYRVKIDSEVEKTKTLPFIKKREFYLKKFNKPIGKRKR